MEGKLTSVVDGLDGEGDEVTGEENENSSIGRASKVRHRLEFIFIGSDFSLQNYLHSEVKA